MSAPAIIQSLVNRFRDSRELYRSGRYNEAQLRQEFLNPLFETLGWDMYNRSNFAPQYREVIHEDSLEDQGSLKAPDYAFRIGTTRKFFVEAKKPAVDIRYDIHPAYQLRRYAWNAHLPLSILTDFEELAVYDCRTRPDPQDSAATGRVMLFTFEDYLTRWDELAAIFSKDAVWNGSFDRYAESSKGKRGTTEVDNEFLKEIEQWRLLLARNIALRNFRPSASAETSPNLHRAERQLNYAVQTTIDRILFLRICEDRKIEPTDQLLQIAEGTDIYAQLLILFQKADQTYNSGLFHFNKEKGQTSDPDTFTPSLQIDDKVLRQVIKSTYYPCPYMFNEIPVEILGQVYEQFLGSVIRLTPGGQAKVEEKPEVRKAGGVYYTPRYIVDYIVQNTLGRLLGSSAAASVSALSSERVREAGVRDTSINEDGLETLRSEAVLGRESGTIGKTGTNPSLTPAQALNLRVVDPACGSGSFLLGAYQYLLDWHLNYYLNHDPQSHSRGKNPPLVATEGGEYRLTTETKKRILTSNIYGVDIDAQAVEVTKLSLLLKLLEGETGQLALGFERVLPDLGQNIRCGNSLIGWDYFQGQMFPDEEEIHRVNPFDWQRAFPHVFAAGGFDAVIGNPPYLKEANNKSTFDLLRDSGASKYCIGKMDLWYAFACISLDMIRSGGLHSFIATNNWVTNSGAKILREKINSEATIVNYVDFSDYKVFSSASIQTMIYIMKKERPISTYALNYLKIIDPMSNELATISALNAFNNGLNLDQVVHDPRTTSNPFTFNTRAVSRILFKMLRHQFRLPETAIGNGIDVLQDYVAKRHIVKLKNNAEVGDGVFVLTDTEKLLVAKTSNDLDKIKPYYTTKELGRYYADNKNTQWIVYADRYVRENIKLFPGIKQHLDSYKPILTSAFAPYGLHRPREEGFFLGQKLLSIRKTRRASFTYTDFPCYVSRAFLIIKLDERESIKYFLGILNSSLIQFWLYYKGKKQGDQLQVDKEPLCEIPIRKIDFQNEKDVELHDKLVHLVEQMIHLQSIVGKTPIEKEQFKRATNATDITIDRLVYELYGLTDEEIKIVELS